MTDSERTISLLAPKALGDVVISTAVLRELLSAFPQIRQLLVFTNSPVMFHCLEEADRIAIRGADTSGPEPEVDLSGYLHALPHQEAIPRHHVESMLSFACSELGLRTTRKANLLPPRFIPSRADEREVERRFDELSVWRRGRPLVWLCRTSSTTNRNPSLDFWMRFVEEASQEIAFVDLLAGDEEPLPTDNAVSQSFGLGALSCFMKLCDAGVAVDTFGLHFAAASGCSRVVALLASSHPKCVCYPGNRWVYKKSPATSRCQPCGNHGYADSSRVLAKMRAPEVVKFDPATGCIHSKIECLRNIAPADVINELAAWFPALRVSIPRPRRRVAL